MNVFDSIYHLFINYSWIVYFGTNSPTDVEIQNKNHFLKEWYL